MSAVSSIESKATPRRKLATHSASEPVLNTVQKLQKCAENRQSDCPSRARTSAAKSSSQPSSIGSHGGRDGENAPISRNGRRREKSRNTNLSFSQAQALLVGALNAVEVGLPLNRFMTIDWKRVGVPDPVGATGMFLKLIKDALRKQGQSTAYIWVQECGSVVGQHAHILLHVPPHRRKWFNGLQAGWLKRCGATRGEAIVRSKPVGASYSAAFGDEASRANYRHSLDGLLDYLLKDAEPKARAVLGIQHSGSFGTVIGKRSAVSQNLRRRTPGVAASNP